MRSIQNQIAWSYRAHWVLSILMVFLMTLFVMFAWRPASRRQAMLKEEMASNSKRLELFRSNSVNVLILSNEVSRLEAKLQRFNKRLPKTAELGEFIRDLTQISEQFNLRKIDKQPGTIRRLELYSEVPITMHFEGDFGTVYNFLRQMEEMQRLTRVKSLTIKCKDGKLGQVDVNMAMNIYFSEL